MPKAPKEAAVLISPSGAEYVPGTAQEANDLIYAHGYKPKADVSPDAAVTAAGSSPVEAAGAKTAPKKGGGDSGRTTAGTAEK